jgi:outer membrane biosynthesis protein TonB
MIQKRRKRNSSKVNLTISFIVHSLLIAGIFFFAAREGMLGKKLKELTVTMVPKEKKPEPPKEKPPEPKIETPKVAEAPRIAPPPMTQTAPPPPPAPTVDAPPSVAPAAAVLPSFDFTDGAKSVQAISDPNGIYKALVEHALRSHWNRPEDMADDAFVAEVELSVEPTGKVGGYRWLSGSGDKRWDDTVKTALAQTKALSRPPPKGFPEKFTVRFDVESQRSESVPTLLVQ